LASLEVESVLVVEAVIMVLAMGMAMGRLWHWRRHEEIGGLAAVF
jgi:hypothetical protein